MINSVIRSNSVGGSCLGVCRQCYAAHRQSTAIALCRHAAIALEAESSPPKEVGFQLNPGIHHVTHRPKNLTRIQSPATKARFRSEKSVLR